MSFVPSKTRSRGVLRGRRSPTYRRVPASAVAYRPIRSSPSFSRRSASRILAGVLAVAFSGWASTPPVRADVNLEWRPTQINTDIGQPFQLGIFAVSDGSGSQAVGSIDAVFSWEPTVVELLEVIAPCTQEPCPAGTYLWSQLDFPNDESLDGLNNTWADGNAYLQAVAQPGGFNSAFATPQGLRVATLTFRAKGGGAATIRFHALLGSFSHTRVFSGQFAGLDITGRIDSQTIVSVTACGRPTVESIGSRYLKIIPSPSISPVALQVLGDAQNTRITCLSKFVQLDGSLSADPVYITSLEWGSVFVSDIDIRPSSTYSVRMDCRMQTPNLFSSNTDVTTARWGDVTGNGGVGIDDVTGILSASQGQFPPGAPVERYDLMPCIADGVVDGLDVEVVVGALQQGTFPCADPCTGPGYDDAADLQVCLTGPAVTVSTGCQPSDRDGDGDCDLRDAALLQRAFSGLGAN